MQNLLNLLNEFWVINIEPMGIKSKSVLQQNIFFFFHPGLSAWHAKLLRVYCSQRLPPIRVQRLETHHFVSASEDMVNGHR